MQRHAVKFVVFGKKLHIRLRPTVLTEKTNKQTNSDIDIVPSAGTTNIYSDTR